MRIGILQTGHAPDQVIGALGDYSDMFEQLLGGHDFTFQTFSVVDNVFPDSPDLADGWLITGSRHAVYEDHAWIAPLEELIRKIAASGKPLIGICFGHQIIAQALGGKVEKYRGGWAAGRQVYDFGDEKLALNAWHQDQVVELPEGAQVIAENATCKYAGLVIGDNILTVQPHPEFDAQMMSALLEYRGAALPDELREKARAGLTKSTASDQFADRMAAFFRKGAK
jgi:GMP synthase (glutamine-hydrolysing)